jgi:hypothetical protein
MKMKLLTLVLLAAGSLFAESHWSIGIGIGTPYYAPLPPPPVVTYTPPCPSPEYTWVPGYYYPVGGRFAWHAGFWSRPPYSGAYWVTPRYYETRYYPGYWGHRERRWDRDDRERWEHHDQGLHRGWYRRHGDD